MSNPSALTLANLQERFRKALKEKNFFTNILEILETKTKVNREYIAYGKYNFFLFIVFQKLNIEIMLHFFSL